MSQKSSILVYSFTTFLSPLIVYNSKIIGPNITTKAHLDIIYSAFKMTFLSISEEKTKTKFYD